MESQLSLLEKELHEQEKRLSSFFHMRDLLPTVKRETFKSVLKVANVEHRHLTSENKIDLSRFLLMSHFFAPTLTSVLKSDATSLGVKTTLDEALIDRVITEEQERDRRAQSEITRGESQVRQRTIK